MSAPDDYEMRPCPACGREHLLRANGDVCFRCWRAANPFQGAPGIRIDAAGDDSRDARRVADGTAGYNMGLGGVETRDGYRPIANREVGSNGSLREHAKRAGLVPYEKGVYRAPALK